MALQKNKWRVVTWKFTDNEGIQQTREYLIPPGYHAMTGEGHSERLAIPEKVDGPFVLYDNGHGTIQIRKNEGDEIAFVSYMHFQGKRDCTPEQALWMAQVIVNALNNPPPSA